MLTYLLNVILSRKRDENKKKVGSTVTDRMFTGYQWNGSSRGQFKRVLRRFEQMKFFYTFSDSNGIKKNNQRPDGRQRFYCRNVIFLIIYFERDDKHTHKKEEKNSDKLIKIVEKKQQIDDRENAAVVEQKKNNKYTLNPARKIEHKKKPISTHACYSK